MCSEYDYISVCICKCVHVGPSAKQPVEPKSADGWENFNSGRTTKMDVDIFTPSHYNCMNWRCLFVSWFCLWLFALSSFFWSEKSESSELNCSDLVFFPGRLICFRLNIGRMNLME